jgi:hypothetical protein
MRRDVRRGRVVNRQALASSVSHELTSAATAFRSSSRTSSPGESRRFGGLPNRLRVDCSRLLRLLKVCLGCWAIHSTAAIARRFSFPGDRETPYEWLSPSRILWRRGTYRGGQSSPADGSKYTSSRVSTDLAAGRERIDRINRTKFICDFGIRHSESSIQFFHRLDSRFSTSSEGDQTGPAECYLRPPHIISGSPIDRDVGSHVWAGV